MINVTVKTLDSQNHQFTVDANLTVEQFKNYIADTVDIPADRQRIIYCGRILQDTSKLSDYDVDGKVVHLVHRAPPSTTTTTRNVRSLTPPPDFNRARGGFRGFDRVGNAVYMGLGSMTFPQGLMDPTHVIPPRATHTLSSSRLNVARRMLRNAEHVIRQLEAPNSEEDSEEPAEEEMTPVIEARVIVPSGDQPFDETAIINAVQNTIFPTVGGRTGPTTSSGLMQGSGSRQLSTSAPETPRSTSTENLNAEANSEPPREVPRQSQQCRGTEMAVLLRTLNELQVRLAPFLARYQAFMEEDPQVPASEVTTNHHIMNRVSKVLHYFGHAYHSLSDIIIHVDQPPPRLLLCRPILIQPPPVVQAGIPIQVEAQVHVSADRPMAPNSSSTNTTSNAPVHSQASSTTASNATPTNQTQSQPTATNSNLTSAFVGAPFLPTGAMRVISTPLEIRTLRSNTSRSRTSVSADRSTASSATANSQSNQSATVGDTATAPPATTTTTTTTTSGGATEPQAGRTSNPNLEFFMEVTPEALRSGNLVQSLMQIVGTQIGESILQAQNQRAESLAQSNSQPGNAQQTSQSRPTQSNSGTTTTSTGTRSTPRPHVHMTQQAVQGGFDPFLHCYSHHINHIRPQRLVSVRSQSNRQEASSATGSPTAPAQPGSATAENTNNELPDMVRQFQEALSNLPADMFDISRIFGSRDTRPGETGQQETRSTSQQTAVVPPRVASTTTSRQNGNGEGSEQGQERFPDLISLLSGLMNQNLPDLLPTGPTLDVYMRFFNPEFHVAGESLVADLIMLLLRNLRINDLFIMSSGNLTPLYRLDGAIRDFVRSQVCENDTSETGIARGTDRIIVDFRPILGTLESITARDNINMVSTIDGFLRQRLPAIIRLALIPTTTTEGDSSAQQDNTNLLSTIFRATSELFTLAIHCSANGQQDVETACADAMLAAFFSQSNVPNEIHNFVMNSGRAGFRTILEDLNIPVSDIEQYVVRDVPQDDSINVEDNIMQQDQIVEPEVAVESMEVDLPVESSAQVEDPEPFPNVVWGSEPWHRQTPEEWVPIITRDIQKQKKQNCQPPFSDAYISGMPSKRRKLINDTKPQGSISQVISDGVRQAVTTTGLSSSAPLDVVAQAAADSVEIQSAYRRLLRTSVRSNLRNNEDFNPERYPNIARYFDESTSE
ncbi:hypothetical protein ABEB36_006645 [Hypothenemus hampei]|uniref:Large proline-rich protein BAG6 n=1 Tax=Hypothenemus hampei TaxID=57062 RepID=A0ABD1EU96_HYPHA